MAYLKKIVKYINDGIKGCLPECKSLVVDIAEQMVRPAADGKLEIFPSYVNENGEGVYVGPDDDYDVIIYHRINSIQTGRGRVQESFGDDNLKDTHVVRIGMVVFGMRDSLKLSNDEMAVLLHANFPDAVTKEMLKELSFSASNINVKDINLNDMQVFMEEFQNVQFFLKPEQFLLKMNYTIESAFLKRCFKKCC